MNANASKFLIECLDALWTLGGTDLVIIADTPPLGRVNGAIRELPNQPVLTAADTLRVAQSLLGPELSARFEKDRQVDFAFSWRDQARLRVNAYMQKGTAALAMRMIPFRIPTMSELGLPPLVVEQWVRLPRGLILVTGPTGSGKSTTLASVLDHINGHRALHIVTIEDPIEYVHHRKLSAVSQREVGFDTHSFADALRAALREDPDVLLVGEMRDPESIQATLTIAETGHLVFATLHTNDTSQALNRIIDVFPSSRQPQIRLQLAHTLAGILHQILVPCIGGGRVAAFDVLNATPAAKNLIREGKTRQIRNLIATGQREGMLTLESSLSSLVATGLVDYEEAKQCSLYPGEVLPPPAPAGPGGSARISRP
ncbi:MAG: type IV pilus twitching motility protein PilT [Actinomycetota bacterium]